MKVSELSHLPVRSVLSHGPLGSQLRVLSLRQPWIYHLSWVVTVVTPNKIPELRQELGQKGEGHWDPGLDPKFLFIIFIPETAP
jgi:hypothetical protein